MNDHTTLFTLDILLSRSSTEEVIALFISIAFVGDALKGTVKSKSIQGQTALYRVLNVRLSTPKGNVEAPVVLFVRGNVARQMYTSITVEKQA